MALGSTKLPLDSTQPGQVYIPAYSCQAKQKGNEDLEEIEAFAKSLEVGIPRETIGLLEIGPALQRGEYLALSRAGIRDARTFESADRSQLASILGEERTKQRRPESKDDRIRGTKPTN